MAPASQALFGDRCTHLDLRVTPDAVGPSPSSSIARLPSSAGPSPRSSGSLPCARQLAPCATAGSGPARWAILTPDVPVPRVLAVPRADGWYRARSRETVFLVWNGAREVRAFSATCTHLGCQVVWDAKAKRFRCPCHGGAYDANGQVLDGPPPRALDTIDARVDGTSDTVLVRV